MGNPEQSMETTEDYSKMKVVELKKLLKDRGLTVTGTKDELIERLKQHNEANEKKLLDDMMEETEENTESAAASIDEELENEIMNESGKAVVGDKRKIDNGTADNQKTEENKENSAGDGDDKQEEPTKKIIKLSAITPEEKKELRAKKFGLTEDEKKEARAKRFGISAPITTPSLSTTKPVTTVKRTPITSVSTKDSELLKKRAERFGIGQSSPSINKTKLTPEEEEKRKKRAERFGIAPPAVTPPAVSTADDKE